MLNLLKLEWLKQRHYVFFKLLVIAYLILLPAALFVGKSLDTGGNGPLNPAVHFFEFPTVWEWLGYIGNWMVFFMLGFMGVLLVTNEYGNRTLRQNIITGLHRSEFFWSKVAFMVLLATGAALYYGLCAIVIGTLHIHDTWYFSTIFKNVDMVPRYWLMCMGYMSFGLLVGVLTRRTGIGLFIYFAYALVGELVLRWLVHVYLLKIKNISMSFYPLNAMEDLAPLPVADMADDLLREHGFRVLLTPMEASIASSIYIALFLLLTYKRLKNSDL